MKARFTDKLYEDDILAEEVEKLSKLLFRKTLAAKKIPATITRIRQLYAETFSRDIHACKRPPVRIHGFFDYDAYYRQAKAALSILEKLIRLQPMSESDKECIKGLNLNAADHIRTYLKFDEKARELLSTNSCSSALTKRP